VSDSCRIEDDEIEGLVIGPNWLRLIAGGVTGPPVSTLGTPIQVISTLKTDLTLYAAEKVVSPVALLVAGGSTVIFDESWFNMSNAGVVTLTGTGPITVKSDLIDLPGIIHGGGAEWVIETAKPVFTATLGFTVFAAILGVIIVISIVICVVGAMCVVPEELVDVSSDEGEKDEDEDENKNEAQPAATRQPLAMRRRQSSTVSETELTSQGFSTVGSTDD
jgi:hypothetical protein